jgi:hypothetical protein
MNPRALSYLFAMSTVAFITAAQARTATAVERAACEARVQPRIDIIDSKLRAGYTAREGERLKAQRKKLEVARVNCRKTPN